MLTRQTEFLENSQNVSHSSLWASTSLYMILVVRHNAKSCYFVLTILLVDCGDYVIVTNSRKVKVTGRKNEQLLFRKHTMYPGGLKETPYQTMMERNPDKVRMIAKGIISLTGILC